MSVIALTAPAYADLIRNGRNDIELMNAVSGLCVSLEHMIKTSKSELCDLQGLNTLFLILLSSYNPCLPVCSFFLSDMENLILSLRW